MGDRPEAKNKSKARADVERNRRIVSLATDKAVKNDRIQASQTQRRDRKARKTEDKVVPFRFKVFIHFLCRTSGVWIGPRAVVNTIAASGGHRIAAACGP